MLDEAQGFSTVAKTQIPFRRIRVFTFASWWRVTGRLPIPCGTTANEYRQSVAIRVHPRPIFRSDVRLVDWIVHLAADGLEQIVRLGHRSQAVRVSHGRHSRADVRGDLANLVKRRVNAS